MPPTPSKSDIGKGSGGSAGSEASDEEAGAAGVAADAAAEAGAAAGGKRAVWDARRLASLRESRIYKAATHGLNQDIHTVSGFCDSRGAGGRAKPGLDSGGRLGMERSELAPRLPTRASPAPRRPVPARRWRRTRAWPRSTPTPRCLTPRPRPASSTCRWVGGWVQGWRGGGGLGGWVMHGQGGVGDGWGRGRWQARKRSH